MNITHFLSEMDDGDREKFCEAIADTLNYLTDALDILPENLPEIREVDRLWRFQGWLQGFNGGLEAWMAENPPSDDDADDADDDTPEININAMLAAQWTNEIESRRGCR
jgi:hypothetical protein